MDKKLTRRQALRIGTLGGATGLLAACTSAATQPAEPAQVAPTAVIAQTIPTQPPKATLATTESAETAKAPPTYPTADTNAQSAAPTIAPTSAVATSPQLSGAGALAQTMSAATAQFLATLDDAQRAKASYAFDDAERMRWHWTTPSGFPRNGMPLREMSQAQKDAAFALLRASLSEAGFQKTLDIISLQNDLGNDPELYYVTVFGTPDSVEPWSWRWEGHHVSRHFTLKGDQVVVTPFFHGSWPTVSSTGLRAMPREEDAARELVLSMSDQVRASTIFQNRTLTRHMTWNEPRVNPLDPVGVLVGDLTPDQQTLVNEIINTYLSTQIEPIAAQLHSKLQTAGLEAVRFGWAGSLEPRRPHYYRLQGPTFLLEFDNSRNGGTHIHSVWRDYSGDFGYSL